jgi:dTDP-4-dehydrorhamnose 3,5-epimerase
MDFTHLPINDLILIQPHKFADHRGYMMETFQKKVFDFEGIQLNIAQINQSGSVKGVLRGLHYQIQQPQGKLVKVLKGKIFDVAVDLRKSSPTFGKWAGITLDDEESNQLWVPQGFAHGFLVLSDWAEIEYCTTDYYAPEFERTLLWSDPDIGIQWPINEDMLPVLSQKDRLGKNLKDAEVYE